MKTGDIPLKIYLNQSFDCRSSFIGYKLIAVTLDLAMINIRDFAMEEAIAELHEM